MAATPSQMLTLGTPLPSFSLPDTVSGQIFDSARLRDAPASIVAFICNHCPFVIHIRDQLAEFGRFCQERDVRMVAVSSNDVDHYAADGPQRMAEEAARVGYTFPYLYDESQAVAQTFHAACTPEFYLFDGSARLVYRGQFDDSRPGNGVPVTGADLRSALEAVLAGESPSEEQKPSVGCNIKWKPGNAPDYFG
jgi:peroxiredoxin